MKLETDRLIIQDTEGNNANGMVQYISILQITHFVSDWANLFTENGSRGKRLMQYVPETQAGYFVSDWLCSEMETMIYMVYSIHGIERYAICLKSNGHTIGDLFVVTEEHGTYNIGLHFNKGFNGKGYGIEAANAFIGHLFDSAAAEHIYGFVETGDMRSKRMCERLGMHTSGHIDKAVAYAIGRNDWHEMTKNQ
ncbi:GNAT family N-acetyltransferase [Parabacteroides distasonis]|uniref:GNAT family N-acetyltransferase n=1 Tax=Parabacteroides distasonis TaxID=823 RepID=UPI001C3C71EE|nr:GNAT family N-acetyltransferase [Parabacteroides distasonis]MCR1851945.1 GNAT family N-acetyltransferase [Parabacteroides distasonis]